MTNLFRADFLSQKMKKLEKSCTVASGCCARHPRSCTDTPNRQYHHHRLPQGSTPPSDASRMHYASCALSISQGLLDGHLPWRLNAAARGVNGEQHVPKRNWARGGVSGSMSRSMQHAFMWQFVDGAGSRPPRGRCLDWDGWYGGSIFASLCAEVDVLVYAEPFGPGPTKPLPKGSSKVVRWWHADAHTMSRVLPMAAFDLIIANSVFEHLEKPLLAMQQAYELLRPGGTLFWHTPFMFPEHGVPRDYFRYTAAGARLVAERAGMEVEFAQADGGAAAVIGNVLGLSAKFWTPEELAIGTGAPHEEGGAGGRSADALSLTPTAAPPTLYLSTRMIARRPAYDKAPAAEMPATGPRPVGIARNRGLRRRGSAPVSTICPSSASGAFAAAVRQAWINGELPDKALDLHNGTFTPLALHNGTGWSATNREIVTSPSTSSRGSSICQLRAAFWTRIADEFAGRLASRGPFLARRHRVGLRCLLWKPSKKALTVTLTLMEEQALSRLCEQTDRVSTLSLSRGRYELLLSAGGFARSVDPWATMRRAARLLEDHGVIASDGLA